ncbi:MAG: cytochrome c oxidase assembly protein [Terricaulis sp.]|nr:cytochrome c oxidase assembly protein [Terricaulis sp.]
MSAPQKPGAKRLRTTALLPLAAVAGMLGLAFSAVPLYDAFCKLTGYGGTTMVADAAPSTVLDQRMNVRFDANVTPGLPIAFAPKQREQGLRIGESGLALYTVRNTSDEPVSVIATFNVTPHAAGQYFAKLECFCFQDRVLQPGEEADLPVVYFVDPEIVNDPDAREIHTVTLSYTYFRSTTQAAAPAAQAPGKEG